jgi:hypothetical protein
VDNQQEEDPYLSIVAVSRNDNHGGRLTYRMQKFIDGFVAQCKRHQVHAELILVEWNPPEDRPFLDKVLKYPKDLGPASIRIIQVPPELHHKYDHSKNLPLFQMIGKNVGIRRAKGKFILATNIDILFSDPLFKFFKEKKLKEGIIYRCDRLDIPAILPETENFDEILKFCKKKYFLINRRAQSIPRRWIPLPLLIPILIPFGALKYFLGTPLSNPLRRKLYRIHSNACGDFTLLSKNDWERLRGYVEWPMYSFHIDSILMYQGILGNLKQKNFGSKKPIYHIAHQIGSGYTPEGVSLLFERLDKGGVPYLSDEKLLQIAEKAYKEGKTRKKILQFQEEDWGLIDHPLPELTITPC